MPVPVVVELPVVVVVELLVQVCPSILLMPKSDSDLVTVRVRLGLGLRVGVGVRVRVRVRLESDSDRLNVPPSPCLGALGGGGESPPPAAPPAPFAKALCWRCVFALSPPLCAAAGRGSDSSKHPSRVCETWLGVGLGLGLE